MLVSTELTQALFKKPSAHAPPHIHKRKKSLTSKGLYHSTPTHEQKQRATSNFKVRANEVWRERKSVCMCLSILHSINPLASVYVVGVRRQGLSRKYQAGERN